MLRETKFGYGYLMVGTGLPYLIDKALGLAWAIFVSVTFVVVGGAFLCAGHRQRGEQAGPRRTKLGWLAFGCTLSTLIVLISLGILRSMPKAEPDALQKSAEQKQVSSSQTTQSASETLLVRYTRSDLPIRIAPRDTAYILQLNPNISEWVWEIPNLGQKAMTWPPDLHPKKGGPLPDSIYACEFTNDEDKTLLDVTISFEVSFHELEILPATITHNKDGTESWTLPTPGRDYILVAYGGSKDHAGVTAARDGNLVKQFTRSASLPSIGPRSTARIYLINQSRFISKFTFPQKATAVVAGNPQRIKVALIRPNVTVEDAAPWFGLAPPRYHWKGVSGAP
jgi:hypothetical protein